MKEVEQALSIGNEMTFDYAPTFSHNLHLKILIGFRVYGQSCFAMTIILFYRLSKGGHVDKKAHGEILFIILFRL